MKRLLLPVASLSLIAAGFGAGIAVSATAAEDDAPAVTVSRQSLAEVAAPQGAPKRTLGLSRVVVMPGAELAPHHHAGDQVAYITQGVLTYTVISGEATAMKGPGDTGTVVKKLHAGDSVKLRTGMWLIEHENEVHQAANAGEIPIVIMIATLARTGAPSAILDDVTTVPPPADGS